MADSYENPGEHQMVLGFLFDQSLRRVLLLLKSRPDWQKNFYNGVGGKVEASDLTIHHAMSREFFEEASLNLPPTRWFHFATMKYRRAGTGGADVHCFAAAGNPEKASNDLDDSEPVHVYSVNNLPVNTLYNIPWLVAMGIQALATEQGGEGEKGFIYEIREAPCNCTMFGKPLGYAGHWPTSERQLPVDRP